MARRTWLVTLAALAVIGAAAHAQEAKASKETKDGQAATTTQPQKDPLADSTVKHIAGPFREGGWPERPPLPQIADPEVAAAHALLIGSFASDAMEGAAMAGSADIPALVYNAARIDVTGLDNAVYFEVARADSPGKPFRQGVLHVFKPSGGTGNSLKLRVFDFGGMPSFEDAVVAMWLAPDLFPRVDVTNLNPNADIPLTKSGDRYEGKSAGRVPTVRNGAVEFEAGMGFGGGSVSMWDRGFDGAGKQVFGLLPGKSVQFKTATPSLTARRTPEALVIIDLVPPTGGPVASKESTGRIAVHYTGWLHTDGWKIASSKDARWDGSAAEPLAFSLQARLLSGWSEGMPGMTKGGIRRLIIPSGMAFHNVGSREWRVPPNTPLIFEVECLWVEEPPAAAPEGAAPAPAADPSKPVGGGAEPGASPKQ